MHIQHHHSDFIRESSRENAEKVYAGGEVGTTIERMRPHTYSPFVFRASAGDACLLRFNMILTFMAADSMPRDISRRTPCQETSREG